MLLGHGSGAPGECRSACRPTSRKPDERARLAQLLRRAGIDAGGIRAAVARGRWRTRLVANEPVAPAARAALRVSPADSPIGLAAAARSAAGCTTRKTTTAKPPVDPFAPRDAAAGAARRPTKRAHVRAAVAAADVIKTALAPAGARRASPRVHAADGATRSYAIALIDAIEDGRARAGAADRPSRAIRRRAIRESAFARRSRPIPASSRSTCIRRVDVARARSHDRWRSTRRRARSRLGTEKFMLDGRHTGTGGGNHVTLGGATRGRQPAAAPARSAAKPHRATGRTIRRCRTCSPGTFIGPTSQAPRVDEARDDRLYELEIAFQRARARRTGKDDDAAVARRPAAAPPADRPHRQHAPRRVLDRQALLARQRDRPARACSSSAPSRCRRTRA